MTERRAGGLSTAAMLVLSVSLVIAGCTAVSLRLVSARMQRQIQHAAESELARSLAIYRDVEAGRLAELRRENALLADLPSLKALMTTADRATIQDGGEEFWRVGNTDLFALAAPTGAVQALYTRGDPAGDLLRLDLETALRRSLSVRPGPGGQVNADRPHLVSGDRLFDFSVQPIFFGDAATGTLLGYVITGSAVDGATLGEIGGSGGSSVLFLGGNRGHRVLASSAGMPSAPMDVVAPLGATLPGPAPSVVTLGGQHFLAISEDLSAVSTAPLRLVLLNPLREAEENTREINHVLLLLGLFSVLAGSAIMALVSGWMTRPLRKLAQGVRAFGRGDTDLDLPSGGTREIRGLATDFAAMRDTIEKANAALIESERLATIGRMARSVSHDLRHYLAAVYANAEFLASQNLSREERAELYEEIRAAVLGTTDLIESLLVFSRGGGAGQRASGEVAAALRAALEIVRKHPDTQAVSIAFNVQPLGSSTAWMDSRQVQRALFNLLLNAVQAARKSAESPAVQVALAVDATTVSVTISDNGPGVSDRVRFELFKPFVSDGKEHGTGLGLTLAHQVAVDHGGDVVLEESRPGETRFRFSILREGSGSHPGAQAPESMRRLAGELV